MMITAWDDVFHDLWMHAARHRGMRTYLGSATCPCTRGSDVLAIAAVVDPVLRALPDEPGGHAVTSAWRRCASDLATAALARPDHEYTGNTVFWRTFADVAAYLASLDAAVPEELWSAVLAEIARPDPLPRYGADHARIIRDSHLGLIADTYDRMWDLQRDAFARRRGVELLPSARDAHDDSIAVPRTTHLDIMYQIAFWNRQLWEMERKPLPASAPSPATLGIAEIKRRYAAAVRDANTIAMETSTDAVYPGNREFWGATRALARILSVFDEPPLPPDAAVAELGQVALRNARYPGEGTFAAMFDRQLEDFVQARGFDLDFARARGADRGDALAGVDQPMLIPRTLIRDILQLADYWNASWLRLGSTDADPGLAAVANQWAAVMRDVSDIARQGKPDEVYRHNPAFWRGALALALTLDAHDERPSSVDITIAVTPQAQPEGILRTVSRAITELAHDAAQTAAQSFTKGITKPVLLGGGALLGLWLVLRCRTPKPAEPTAHEAA